MVGFASQEDGTTCCCIGERIKDQTDQEVVADIHETGRKSMTQM